jgi:4-hydroxybenzoate polyprenyltransferase/phosphoserine phosphatase
VAPPLVIDLDGTLILTDMLHESALSAFREAPWVALAIPLWLSRGKAVLKARLAQHAPCNPSTLPYNLELLSWLSEQKIAGRTLVLCTASDSSHAHAIAEHLQLFDEVLASNGDINLAGAEKAASLENRFGAQGFDYAGNSAKDLPVWAKARHAVVVNASRSVEQRARQSARVEKVIAPASSGWLDWLKVIRAHQWLKNLLLFVPLIAAHQASNLPAWWALTMAFVAFSLCASAVYITNDLMDLESDRLHPRKRRRAFASGLVPAWQGVLLIPALLISGFVVAWQVNSALMMWLLIYFFVTCAYSFGLKRLVLVDCLTLAMLYTLRIVAGAAAAGMALTFWLLAESVFLFLSLAFVKRYSELKLQTQLGGDRAHGRGYFTSDIPLIQTLGVSSGMIAVLVMAMYLNSENVLELYLYTELVWAAIPFLLFWISWMWMQADRGNMNDDPLVFAVKDKVSLIAGAGFALVLLAASKGLPWLP